MNKADPKPQDERAARLAQQLRANLHRRKAQARAMDDGGPGVESPAEKAEGPDQ